MDKLLGDDVTDALAFPDNHFDFVTMLAVIEHVADPQALLAEVSRLLKPGGQLIMTAPKRVANALIRLYVDEQHEDYFDLRAWPPPNSTSLAITPSFWG